MKPAAKSNYFIQASSFIIRQLERSKENTEALLDQFGDILLVVDRSGLILKANEQFTNQYNPDLTTRTLGTRLSDYFSQETWGIFRSKMDALNHSSEAMEFELSIHSPKSGQRNVLWAIRPFSTVRAELLSVIGHDVTDLRSFENQFSLLFNNLPIGIVHLDTNLCIIPPVNAFAQKLFGHVDVTGKAFAEVLYSPAWAQLSAEQRESADLLQKAINVSELQFSLLEDRLLRLIFVPTEDDSDENGFAGRWLQIDYRPILRDGQVTSMLILIEDRTTIEMARATQSRQKTEEEVITQRFLNIYRIPGDIRESIFADLTGFFANLDEAVNTPVVTKTILETLREIESAARIGHLADLIGHAHSVHTNMANAFEMIEEIEGEECRDFVGSLVQEWKALKPYFSAVLQIQTDVSN